MIERGVGRDEILALVGVLALLGVASLWFTHLQSRSGVQTKAGRGTRLFFSVATWVSWVGSVVSWLVVLAESVMGPISSFTPVFLAFAFAIVAAPIAQMNARLIPLDADTDRDEAKGGS